MRIFRSGTVRGTFLFAVVLTIAPLTAVSDELHAVDVVSSFHRALARGDGDVALDHLSSDLVVFESGGAEMSRDEYASHHLEADMEFSRATERTVVSQQEIKNGSSSAVLTRTTTKGTFRGHELDLAGVETMLLRKTRGRWHIVHIHWSSHSRD